MIPWTTLYRGQTFLGGGEKCQEMEESVFSCESKSRTYRPLTVRHINKYNDNWVKHDLIIAYQTRYIVILWLWLNCIMLLNCIGAWDIPYQHQHILLQVGPTDSGFYSCVAGNILGESVSSAYLEINSSPYVTAGHWMVVMVVASLLLQHHHINTLAERTLWHRQWAAPPTCTDCQ